MSIAKELTDDVINETRCKMFLWTPKCRQVGQITESNKTCMVLVTGGRAGGMQREGKGLLRALQAGGHPLAKRYSQEAQQATPRTAPRLGRCFAGPNLWESSW